jgi:hypothetical protein
MGQRPHHQIPSIEAAGRLASGAKIFRGVELWLNRGDDGFGDLVLNRENVGKFAVVAFRPDVTPGGDIIELRCNPNAITAFANAALDHIADPKLLGDLLHVHGFALVDE